MQDAADVIRLKTAIQVVSDHLHDTLDSIVGNPGASARSCVQSSLATAAFFNAVGIAAETRPVALLLRVMRGTEQIGFRLIGSEEGARRGAPGWHGHMVVVTRKVLFDTTFKQAELPDLALPTTVSVPLQPDAPLIVGLEPLSTLMLTRGDGIRVSVAWLDTPRNTTWSRGENATAELASGHRRARAMAVQRLTELFRSRMSDAPHRRLPPDAVSPRADRTSLP